jgi:hypothetical protein
MCPFNVMELLEPMPSALAAELEWQERMATEARRHYIT